MLASIFTILFSSLALAAPSLKISGCDVSKAKLSLPTGQTQLVTPTTTAPAFIGIGVGIQNYTCASAGTYSSTGAVAELFDISCLNPSLYTDATELVFDLWKVAPKSLTAQQVINDLSLIKSPVILGQHYFITNPITGTGLSPKWDFTSASEKGHSNAFVVGAKAGDIVAPTNPTTDVDWLMLNGVQGDLAKQVFRIQTRGGQPPTSCTPGTPDISVKYVSQYWLFGGSF
ncbi:hypothetical protein C8Q75DRAFT_752322 [Abortiporus biennis]|nr:hypothetical protein C8Q75DRAFT_752322 [Abortiporus biennis]